MNSCVENLLSGEQKDTLVILKVGIYTSADSGGKRVRVDKKTPGLVIRSFGNQIVVSIGDNKTVLTNERECEKLQ
jgi:hypothetical protein|tara:strand:- start:2816 stop:3040 length:225 start_codon:yes stop_codon:yes gene_type:complete